MSEKNRVNLCLKPVSVQTAHLIFWPLFIIGLVADLITKSVIFNWLSNRVPNFYSVIDGFFELVMVENRGAAWGIAANKTVSLVVISIIALIIVFGIFLFGRNHQLITVVALGMFAAGITGNLYDRIFNEGSVRDFLDFYYNDWHFPAFNIADSLLTIAVGLLILSTLFSPNPKSSE
ncbi:MAG TPA: signal peptidase II [Phycisphaerales bacterium]|nr:signal peptidase II [Phycisphaerales bacterium]